MRYNIISLKPQGKGAGSLNNKDENKNNNINQNNNSSQQDEELSIGERTYKSTEVSDDIDEKELKEAEKEAEQLLDENWNDIEASIEEEAKEQLKKEKTKKAKRLAQQKRNEEEIKRNEARLQEEMRRTRDEQNRQSTQQNTISDSQQSSVSNSQSYDDYNQSNNIAEQKRNEARLQEEMRRTRDEQNRQSTQQNTISDSQQSSVSNSQSYDDHNQSNNIAEQKRNEARLQEEMQRTRDEQNRQSTQQNTISDSQQSSVSNSQSYDDHIQNNKASYEPESRKRFKEFANEDARLLEAEKKELNQERINDLYEKGLQKEQYANNYESFGKHGIDFSDKTRLNQTSKLEDPYLNEHFNNPFHDFFNDNLQNRSIYQLTPNGVEVIKVNPAPKVRFSKRSLESIKNGFNEIPEQPRNIYQLTPNGVEVIKVNPEPKTDFSKRSLESIKNGFNEIPEQPRNSYRLTPNGVEVIKVNPVPKVDLSNHLYDLKKIGSNNYPLPPNGGGGGPNKPPRISNRSYELIKGMSNEISNRTGNIYRFPPNGSGPNEPPRFSSVKDVINKNNRLLTQHSINNDGKGENQKGSRKKYSTNPFMDLKFRQAVANDYKIKHENRTGKKLVPLVTQVKESFQRLLEDEDSGGLRAMRKTQYEVRNTLDAARYMAGTSRRFKVKREQMSHAATKVGNVGRFLKGANDERFHTLLKRSTRFNADGSFGLDEFEKSDLLSQYKMKKRSIFKDYGKHSSYKFDRIVTINGQNMKLRNLSDHQLKKLTNKLIRNKILGKLSIDEEGLLNESIGLSKVRQQERMRNPKIFTNKLIQLLSKSDESGVTGVVLGLRVYVNPYARRLGSLTFKTGKTVTKVGVKGTVFVVKKVGQVTGASTLVHAKTQQLLHTRGAMKFKSLGKKAYGQLNGGIYRSTKKMVLKRTPTRIKTAANGISGTYHKLKEAKFRIGQYYNRAKEIISKPIKFVTTPFKIVAKGLNIAKAAILKVALGFVLTMTVVSIVSSVIAGGGQFLLGVIWPFGNGDNTASAEEAIDLSPFVSAYNDAQNDFLAQIYELADNYDDVVYPNGMDLNNSKEILSMMGVRRNFSDMKKEDDAKAYIEKLYGASHSYTYNEESYVCSGCKEVIYNCTEPGHEIDNSAIGGCLEKNYSCTEAGHEIDNSAKGGCQRTYEELSEEYYPDDLDPKTGDRYAVNGKTYEWNGTKWVREIYSCPGTHIERYCPGGHVEKICEGHMRVYIYLKTLKFENDEIFNADTESSNLGGIASTSQQEFINKIAVAAIEDQRTSQILPSVTIAQAIEESGWGRSKLAMNANNLFGMTKGSWKGEVYTSVNGTQFRKYPTWQDSIKDHSDVLKRNYHVAGITDYKIAVNKIAMGGYCLNPAPSVYEKIILNHIEYHQLYRFDHLSDEEFEELKNGIVPDLEPSDDESSDNSSSKGDEWKGWDKETIDWATMIYENDWEDLYTGLDGLSFEFGDSVSGGNFKDGDTDVVYYRQTDPRFNHQSYGTSTIGKSGCGPTSMAIAVSSLTDTTIDPIQMSRWAEANGYCANESGSYHSLIPAAAQNWGLSCKQESITNTQAIIDALSSGKLVVALMGPGPFTSSGHFIVLTGVTSDQKFHVADPNSEKRSYIFTGKEWPASEFSANSSLRKWWVIGN